MNLNSRNIIITIDKKGNIENDKLQLDCEKKIIKPRIGITT